MAAGFWDGSVTATTATRGGVSVTRLLTSRAVEQSHASCPVTAVAADGATLAQGDAAGVLSVCDLTHRCVPSPLRR